MTIQVGNPVSGENLMRLDKLEMSNETLAQVASGDTSALDGHEDAQIALVCLARELMRARATLEGLRPLVPYSRTEAMRDRVRQLEAQRDEAVRQSNIDLERRRAAERREAQRADAGVDR